MGGMRGMGRMGPATEVLLTTFCSNSQRKYTQRQICTERKPTMQKITPFLWFDRQAEEAAEFYTRTFKNSKILSVSHYGAAAAQASGMPEGSVMTVEFEIEGQRFIGINGGPQFQFSPAISFMVDCRTQEEIDFLWETLSDGGEPNQCGWLKDKFGVSWQITPTILHENLQDEDKERSERVMRAMLEMDKLDIAMLDKAYRG
jgi:predicted 3-demethylubiquinone-9 3-methyltransferase (glyoxalase superfamily)